MKRSYRVVCFILSILLSTVCFGAFAEESSTEAAHIDFNNPSNMVNIRYITDMVTVTAGGRQCLSSSKEFNRLYIYCDISDDFLYDLPIYTPIDITVEYFDKGKGSFDLNYDSYNPQDEFYTDTPIWGSTKTAVELTDTNTWKSYTFHVEDMKFTNRCDNSTDFRIGIWDPFMGHSSEDVIFGSIKVEKSDFISLVETHNIQFKELGHIYSDDEIKFSQDIENKTSKAITVNYEYEYSTEYSNEIHKETIEKKLQPNERNLMEVALANPGFYGIYKLKISEKAYYDDNPSKIYEKSYEEEFSTCLESSKGGLNPFYGVAQQLKEWDLGVPSDSSEAMKKAGITYLRDGYRWQWAEQTKGNLKFPDDVKEDYAKMKENGTEVIFICALGNPNYDEGKAPSSDEAIEAYARYCAYSATELKGIVKYYEIWNEYNATAFNESNEPPETYAKMLKAAYKAIKAVNPEAVVLGNVTAMVVPEWTERMLAAGGYDYLDILTLHPYEFSGSFREFKLIDDVNGIKDIMKKYGGKKPIWFTEIGFSTFDGDTGYSLFEQARNTLLMCAVSRAYDLCDVLIQYKLYDGVQDTEMEDRWGILHKWNDEKYVSGGAKDAYIAVAAMNKLWGINSEFKKVIADDRFYGFDFYNKNMNKDVLLLISGEGEKVQNLELGCDSVEIYDMYGNKRGTMVSDNGIYNLSMGEMPYYIIGNFGKIDKTDEDAIVETEMRSATCTSNDETEFVFKKNTDKELHITIADENENNVKMIDSAEFINGTAKLRLKVSKNDLEAETFRVVITDNDGEVYYNQTHTLNIEPPVTVKLTSEQAVRDSKTHWRARIEVENKSNTSAQSGNISVTEPYEIGVKSPVKHFTNLLPGKKIEFLYNLPERVTKQTMEMTVKTELVNGYSTETSTQLDFGTAVYAKEKPVIDGVVSDGEWRGSWIGADARKDIRLIEDWGGPDDLSFSGTMMWDEENFYFMAIVTDDIMSVTYSPQTVDNMWKGDNIQFALDDRDELNIISIDEFTEIGLATVPGAGDVVYRFKSLYDLPQETVVTNAECKVVNYDSYTVYECRVPWSEIFYDGYIPDTSKTYGFSVLANDNDGWGRRGWIEYTSGIGMTKDARLFGGMKLLK